MMKQQRLEEFAGYGYTTIGDTDNDETIVAKRFDTGSVLIMAVDEKSVTQIRLTDEQFRSLCAL